MKSIYRNLGYVFILFYTIGIFISAYFLYMLPQELINNAKVLSYEDARASAWIFNQANIIIGIELFVGIISIIFLVISERSSATDNVVYIESFKKEKEKSSRASSEQEEITDKNYDELRTQCQQIAKAETDLKKASEKIFSSLAKLMEVSQAAYYKTVTEDNRHYLELTGSFAFVMPESKKLKFEFGEGLIGQVAVEGKTVAINSVPEGYITVLSGLGGTTPSFMALIPVKEGDQVVGVAELASFKAFKNKEVTLLTEIFSMLAAKATA